MARLPYRVLKPISYYGERAERGAEVLLEPSDAENIGSSYVEAVTAAPAPSEPVEPEVAPVPAPAPEGAPLDEGAPSPDEGGAGQ